MSQSNAIELRDVSKLYGSFAALRRVTVEFLVGRCCVILGPNGAGKSTLLRILAGLSRPTYGSVSMFGLPQNSVGRQRVGYLGHESMLYDEMTAMENLRYNASLYSASTDNLHKGCLTPEEALTTVGLDPQLNRPVGKFSQGMRQRAALARVLMAQPELLLLDEPFSNVDVASSARMSDVLAGLRVLGTTILLTTHQFELARPIADNFCMMRDGQIVEMCASGETIPSTAGENTRP